MDKDFYAMQLEKELRQLGMPTYMDEETKEKLLGKDPLTLKMEMKLDEMGQKKTVLIEVYLHKYDQLGFHVPAGFRQTVKDQPEKSNVFPTSSELLINAREAFNLLQGRGVNKVLWNPQTNRFRNSWLQWKPEFKTEENPYAMKELHLPKNTFPIGQLLREYPIRVNKHEELFLIMQSLYSGGIHRLGSIDKEPLKVQYIEANPEKQELQLYDYKGQQVDVIRKKDDIMRVHPVRKKWQEIPPLMKNKRRRR